MSLTAEHLLAVAVKVLEDVQWEGDPEGSYEYQDRTVACPSCNVGIDCETGLPQPDDGDDNEDDEAAEYKETARLINLFADTEGWAIFDIDDDPKIHAPSIQRDDDKKTFASDDEAEAFVLKMAEAGSSLHQQAFEVIEQATKKLDADHEKAWLHDDKCKLAFVLREAEKLGVKGIEVKL